MPTEVDGIKFPSKKEARRYGELKLLEREGKIQGLEVHKRWQLVVNEMRIGYYEADFDYLEDGEHVVEDCKGVRTTAYQLKKRLTMALFGVTIKET